MVPIHLTRLLVASAAAALIGIGSFAFGPLMFVPDPVADVRLEPQRGQVRTGDTFTMRVVVAAEVPVNVFQGALAFNPEQLTVESITYNTSVAGLWAEEPWYQNGDGTLGFAGGTTQPGGFTGEGQLIEVMFRAVAPGSSPVTLTEARILQHDGLGTDAPLPPSIDAIFTVEGEAERVRVIIDREVAAEVDVVPARAVTDLNGDGKQSLADTSIFMQHLVTQNLTSDFNGDGRVSLADLSVLTSAR